MCVKEDKEESTFLKVGNTSQKGGGVGAPEE